jgi:chromate transporter
VADTLEAGSTDRTSVIREIAPPFLRLGFTAFGGPAAHIAMMEEEFVRRRGWVSPDEFLDMLGASNLVPGPSSTEMAIHIGHRRAGALGLAVAGICFIVPAMLIVMGTAWAYVTYGALPQVQGVMYGVKPVVIAIVVQALWRLGRSAIKNWMLATVAALATASALAGLSPLLVLVAAGAIAAAISTVRARAAATASMLLAAPALRRGLRLYAPTVAAAALVPLSLLGLFLFFLKVGAIVYGSGYVLLAFLQADLVDRLHWLTQSQLLDAVAIGQVTPGPVFTTATFIGYLLGGATGAIVATVAIFLPAFGFVALSRPLLPRIRRSPLAAPLLDGVNAGAVALMLAVTWQLGRAAIVDVPTSLLAALSAALLIFTRINSVWLIGSGALAGLAVMMWAS